MEDEMERNWMDVRVFISFLSWTLVWSGRALPCAHRVLDYVHSIRMQREAAHSKESKLDGRIPTIAQILGFIPACYIARILQGFGVCC